MTWSEAKENFLNILNLKRANILSEKSEHRRAHAKKLRQNNFFDTNTDFVIEQCNQALKKIEKCEQFLSDLEDMKACSALTDEFLTQLLNSATAVIENPTNLELYKELSTNFDHFLEFDLNPDKDLARHNAKFYFDAIVFTSVCLPFLIIMIAAGATMGPLAVALPVVALVTTIAIIAVSVQKMNTNQDFSEDVQKKGISDFVNFINPAASSVMDLPVERNSQLQL